MQQPWSSMFTGIALFSLPVMAQAAVSHVEMPINDSGAYWHALASTDSQTLWLGSNQGHIARSEDGGENWSISRPTGTNELAIAQIKAIDERQAFALTQGTGTDSRLYHTRNGGFSWSRVYRSNGNETLRCFDLIPDAEAWVLGNGLNENWHVVRSVNGRSWLASRSGFNSALLPGEGGFNDSASCVRYANDTWAMGSAYATTARIMVKSTNALRFNVIETPISGRSAAVTAVYPLANRDVLLVGGDLDSEDQSAQIFRWKDNDFSELPSPPLAGLLTNLSVSGQTVIVANHYGVAWSNTWGETWQSNDTATRQLSCHDNSCFSLGPEGVSRFTLED